MKNEKPIKVKAITIFTVLCGIITFISIFLGRLLPLYLSHKFNAGTGNVGSGSVGIIGGADGPTAVFVSGQSSFHLFTAIFALLTILGVIYLVVIRYKKNHN